MVACRKSLERLKAEYAQLIRESHYAQLQQQPLLYILSSENFQQAHQAGAVPGALCRDQVGAGTPHHADLGQGSRKNTQARTNLNDKQSSMRAQQHEQDNLARDERRQQEMLSQLKKKEKDLGAALQKKQKEVARLDQKIGDIIRKEAEKQKQKGGITKEQQLVQGDFEKNKGRLPWPVAKGHISGQFGKHKHPVHERVIVDNKGIYIQTTAGEQGSRRV